MRLMTRQSAVVVGAAVLALTSAIGIGVALAGDDAGNPETTTTPSLPPEEAAAARDDALQDLGFAPGTERVPVADSTGEVVGYVDAKYVIGPDSGGPYPPGLPGYPLLDESGSRLVGYVLNGIGFVRRDVADDLGALTNLKACIEEGKQNPETVSEACKTAIVDGRRSEG